MAIMVKLHLLPYRRPSQMNSSRTAGKIPQVMEFCVAVGVCHVLFRQVRRQIAVFCPLPGMMPLRCDIFAALQNRAG
jgi:hypothetical protein